MKSFGVPQPDQRDEESDVDRAPHDLNWLAQRFVLDELDAGEAAALRDAPRRPAAAGK